MVEFRSTGGATVRSPAQDWNNRDLPVYFSRVAQYSTRTPTRSIPSAKTTGSNSPSNGTSSSHKNVGAIVGGAVGGVVALILVLLLGLYCLHRHRKTKKRRSVRVELDGNNVPHMLSAESKSEPSPGMQSVTPTRTTQSYNQAETGFRTASLNATVPASYSDSPIAYPPPVSPYDARSPQGQYFVPVAQTPQGRYMQPSYPPQPVQPFMSQQAYPYNPAEHALHQQHFPPPPVSQPAPPPSSSSGSVSPPSQTRTPANLYPQPLSVARRTGSETSATRGPAQGRFFEQD